MVDTKPQTFQEVQAAIEAAFEDPEFVAELERKMAEVAAEMKEWERKRKIAYQNINWHKPLCNNLCHG